MRKIAFIAIIVFGIGYSGSVYAANYALSFDGVDDYVRVVDSNSLDLSSGMTIEAWIKSSATDGPRDIVSKWDGPIGNQSYIFKDHNNSDKLRIELSTVADNDLADLAGSTSIVTGSWIHVAATYDLTNVRLFYNGVEDNVGLAKAPGNSINNSQAELLFGAVSFSRPGEYFSGLIDEVRIWNYARTGGQLQDWKNYSLMGNESGLVGYWNFDEGVGNRNGRR